MYLPEAFAAHSERDQVKKLLSENPFVALLSFPENERPFINHLPMIWSPVPGEEQIIIGHMAKMNPQWRHFQESSDASVIVNGPHTYITPKWYRDGGVPTWNYAVAHLHGKIELIETFREQVLILKHMSDFFERGAERPWQFRLPDDLKDQNALTSAIISFRFTVETVEAKFKLSQNRNADDRAGVIEGLVKRRDERSHQVRAMMVAELAREKKKS